MNNSIPKEEIRRAKQRQQIVGDCPALNRAVKVALLIAPTDVSVLVGGESGVGKEAFPKIIHQNSLRKHGPYVAVNCGAIPEGTIDSELFGHKKGSFTDAVMERQGYFEVADGGTIFLDEVGELPMATQARLLRVLESGEFMKVGSSDVQRTDIRVVAATNVNLQEAVKRGDFRQDLLYRLNTVTIDLPPLRDRGRDVILLFKKFAADFADKYHMPPIRLDEEAEQLLQSYDWPGNIRQLRNVVERLSVIAPDRMISREVLQDNLPRNAEVRHPALVSPTLGYESMMDEPAGSSAGMGAIMSMLRDVKGSVGELTQLFYRFLQTQVRREPVGSLMMPDRSAEVPVQDLVHPSAPSSPSPHEVRGGDLQADFEELTSTEGKMLTLEEMSQRYIDFVLEKNKGSRKQTAEDLDISERTLYRKLNKQ